MATKKAYALEYLGTNPKVRRHRLLRRDYFKMKPEQVRGDLSFSITNSEYYNWLVSDEEFRIVPVKVQYDNFFKRFWDNFTAVGAKNSVGWVVLVLGVVLLAVALITTAGFSQLLMAGIMGTFFGCFGVFGGTMMDMESRKYKRVDEYSEVLDSLYDAMFEVSA
jgi:predicted phage tail protein